MRDQLNSITPAVAIAPAAAAITDNTAQVGAWIDRRGYEAVTYIITTGALADADATFAVTIEHADEDNKSDAAAVTAEDLVGTLALAGFTFADDGKTRKVGYVGERRYTRITITPANNAGAAPLSAIALLGHPNIQPTANPPA